MLDINDLSVSLTNSIFKPKKPILHGISLSVKSGKIYGFLGPNGAGKTTTIKSILGLVPQYSGSIKVMGEEIGRPELRQKIGFAPENAYFNQMLTPREVLFSLGVLSGMPQPSIREQSLHWLQRLSLDHVIDTQIRTFSKGMKQRLALCQALIHKPDLVILDEPTTGLDPLGKEEVKRLLEEIRKSGATVFLSSHHLLDAEQVCDDICILHHGRVLVQGETKSLLQTGENLEQYFVRIVTAGVEEKR